MRAEPNVGPAGRAPGGRLPGSAVGAAPAGSPQVGKQTVKLEGDESAGVRTGTRPGLHKSQRDPEARISFLGLAFLTIISDC